MNLGLILLSGGYLAMSLRLDVNGFGSVHIDGG